MPADFSKQTAPPQIPYESNSDLSTKDAAKGDRILKADAIPGPTKDIGAGSIGNSSVPFRLNGG